MEHDFHPEADQAARYERAWHDARGFIKRANRIYRNLFGCFLAGFALLGLGLLLLPLRSSLAPWLTGGLVILGLGAAIYDIASNPLKPLKTFLCPRCGLAFLKVSVPRDIHFFAFSACQHCGLRFGAGHKLLPDREGAANTKGIV